MRPGVNTRAGGDRAAGGRRPAGVSRGRPCPSPWCRARRRGVTVNTGTRGIGAGRSPAPGVIMESWIAWLVLAALLGVAEVMTTTLAFGLLAVAAGVAAVVGGVGLSLPFQLGAFVLAAGAGL